MRTRLGCGVGYRIRPPVADAIYFVDTAQKTIGYLDEKGQRRVVFNRGEIMSRPEFNATPVTSVAFGGPGRTWLYVTQGGKVFRRETKRAGVVAWEPVKPPQPGL